MRGVSAFLVVACSASALAGCTMLHSSTDLSSGGISYYLPRSLVVAKVDLYKTPGEPLVPGKPEKSPDTYFANIDINPAANNIRPTRGEIVPDVKERYTLSYNSNPFFHDRYCVVTDSNSLLKSVEYATQDMTPQIVLALTELGRKVGAFAGTREGPPDENTALVSTVSVTFDPFDPNDVAAAERIINNTFNSRVNGNSKANGKNKAADGNDRVDLRLVFPELSSFRRNEAESKCRGAGVCFRTVSKTTLRLWDAKSNKLTASVLVEVVNPHYTGYLDLDRAFMVEKVNRLGFEKGALSQVIMRKPSEVLQTVKVPIAVVETILAVPSNFIAKAGGNDVQNDLSQQRTALTEIKNQLDAGSGGTGSGVFAPACSGGSLN